VGLAQQRYVKSHRILANCRAVKDFRRFRNSQTGLGLVGQFWGLDSHRIKPTNDSWRVDETYVRVKGKWVYLYRAVDSSGTLTHSFLS
jgi:hypothetical protein